jgi:hypothetical protein
MTGRHPAPQGRLPGAVLVSGDTAPNTRPPCEFQHLDLKEQRTAATRRQRAVETRPIVTEADALGDRNWFAEHPGRRYRHRPGPDRTVWLIRHRGGGVYLRTLATPAISYPDADEALRQLWFEAAWPDLDPEQRAELVKEARKIERATGRRR